jgi:vacuolar-type H+-ATPase subunit F/Vma7
MARIVYVGDEVTAAGYRLAGAETLVPAPAEAGDTLGRLLDGDAELVLVSAELLPALSASQVAQLQRSAQPLVSVVTDVFGRHRPAPLVPEVRSALGIEA